MGRGRSPGFLGNDSGRPVNMGNVDEDEGDLPRAKRRHDTNSDLTSSIMFSQYSQICPMLTSKGSSSSM